MTYNKSLKHEYNSLYNRIMDTIDSFKEETWNPPLSSFLYKLMSNNIEIEDTDKWYENAIIQLQNCISDMEKAIEKHYIRKRKKKCF